MSLSLAAPKCIEDRFYVSDQPDPNAIAGFDGPFADSSIYVQTDDGSKSGDILATWYYEADAAPACWVGPAESDTDGALQPATRVGDVWTIPYIEDGVVSTSVLDLSDYMDDDDVNSVVIGAGPNSTPSAPTILVTLSGEDVPVSSNEYPLPASGTPLATSIPIADNEVDTAIRTGQVGVSTFAARADHNHPIRRQSAVANPQPIHALSNGSTVTSEAFLTLRSDEERLIYSYRVNHLIQPGSGWNSMAVPSLAGFQRPIIKPMGTYHYAGQWQSGSAGTPIPFMGQEAAHYLDSSRVYFGTSVKNNAVRTWNTFYLEYIRS